MFKKVFFYLKNNPSLVFLAFYGLFFAIYKSSGSFMGDEATYSLIAKESLFDKSFFVLRWKEQLWFEKPPLVIWLTALSFEYSGIKETSAHIFPAIFAISSSIILYFFGKKLFKSCWAGFFSGFVFLTCPFIAMYSRTNMMDIPVGTFILLGIFSIWKIFFEKKERWWIVLGASTGLAVMTKSVIGLFPIILLSVLIFIFKKKNILRLKYIIYGVGIFFLIASPWHIFMSWKFGVVFWKDYLGYHILERFSSQILPYPWENNSPLGYFKLFWQRSGIWILVFLLSVFAIALSFSKKLPREFSDWKKRHRDQLIFLFTWLFLAAFPFFLSKTKLPNYMILAFYPFVLIIGGSLSFIFSKKNVPALLGISLLSFFNFFPQKRFFASEFGESHLLLPKILIRFFDFSEKELLGAFLILSITTAIIFFIFRKNNDRLGKISLTVILGMNILIPFNPYRNEFIKNMASDIGKISRNKPVEFYARIKPDQFSFHCVGAFYLPPGSRIERLEKKTFQIMPTKNKGQSFCFLEKSFLEKNYEKYALKNYPEGSLFSCQVEN